MKIPFLRFLIRWHFSSDRPLPAWLDRACRREVALGAVRDEEQRLTQGLGAPFHQPPITASPHLHTRVMRAVQASPAERPALSFRGAAAALAAAAVAVAFVMGRTPASPDAPPRSPDIAVTAPAADTGAPAVVVAATFPRLAQGDLLSSSLDRELEYVVADARGVMRFLAASFLPSDFYAQPAEIDVGQGS